MRMRPARAIVCALFAVASVGAASAQRQPGPPDCFDDGRVVPTLASRELAAIARGEAVVTTTDLPERRWPRVCVYRFVDASPEQSLAVLTDYPLRPSYIPDVKVSSVVPATTDSAAK